MASTVNEADISVNSRRSSCSKPKKLSLLQLLGSQFMRRGSLRSIGSSNVLLILCWGFIISCSVNTTLAKTFVLISKSDTPGLLVEGEYLLVLVVVSLSVPMAVLLAEVVISRYTLVSYSLQALWLLSVVDCIFSVSAPLLPVSSSTIHTIEIMVILVPQHVLLGTFLASIVPLGLDQIIGGTDTNISAFIQWLIWVYYAGLALPGTIESVIHGCTHWQDTDVSMILSLLPVVLLSVALILNIYFSHKLIQEPVTVNPVTLIFKVLRYAVNHKYPVQRSAFTYCENEQPSRLDLGKAKYGGPFTIEQVEDVKTFWRVLRVLLVISMLFSPLTSHILSTASEFNLSCTDSIKYNAINPNHIIVVCIPLYELLIYRCLRNRRPLILQTAGISAVALIISSLYGLIAESLQHYLNHTQCFLTESETCFISYIPFNFIIGFVIVLFFKSSVTFLCAQAPYNMRGLLIGVLFTAVVVFIIPGVLLYGGWIAKMKTQDNSRYGIWFYLTTLALTVVLTLLLGYVIQNYKPRERDEICRSRAMVEDIYYKYQEQEFSQKLS